MRNGGETGARVGAWRRVASLLAVAAWLALTPPAGAGEVETTPLAARHYAEHPARYRFLTPADLPADLKWETGATEPEYTDPEARRGGTLRVGIPGYPNTLRYAGPNANHAYRNYLYDNQSFAPVGFHPETNRHVPELALAWAVSADRRTVWYRLDPAARFSDGQPITADDFLFTLFFQTHEYTNDPFGRDYYAREIQSITRYDDHTFAVTLPRAKPDPIMFTNLMPTPRGFYREFGPDFLTRYNRRFQPTPGPYVLRPEDDRVDRSFALTRVESWWGDARPYLRRRFNPDRLEFTVVRDQEKSARIFLAGDLDITLLPRIARFWHGMRDEPPVRAGYVERKAFVNDAPRPATGFYLNTARPPLDNATVRAGLAHAMDVERVIRAFLRGDQERLNQVAEGFGRYTDPGVRARPYDPDTAMRLFRAAGYDRRGPDGILMNAAGERLSFRVLIDADGERKRYVAALADSAKKAGVELTAETLERTTMFKQVKAKSFQIAYWSWSNAGFWPDFYPGFHSDNARRPDTNNITGVADPELDRLIEAFREEQSEPARLALSHRMQRRIHDLAVFIPSFADPGYRLAHWRWVRFPAHFDASPATDPFVYMLFWIDDERRAETRAAEAAGRSFGRQTQTIEASRRASR